MSYTSIEQIPFIVQQARQSFNNGVTKSIAFRKEQLKKLAVMMKENKEIFEKAAYADLRKNQHEFDLTEFAPILSDIAVILKELDNWVKPVKPSVEMANILSGCQIRPEPLGVVLIIGAWNYPFQLLFMPMIGALAAGNSIILKPSEVSSETSKAVAEIVPKYLDSSCIKVVTGGVSETTKLLEQKFDHIFYTGNGNVARIIMSAAAKNLTPVTLELGGKSPVVVADDADHVKTARRIVWGKFLNMGQTCIAPDYILCSKAMQDKLIPEMKKNLEEFYGDAKTSSSYGRVVNQNHFKRLSKLIEKEKVAIGGVTDESDLYISPTIMVSVDPKSPSMQEEIFGPILPVVNISSIEEAIEFINSKEKPLAMYIFSKSFKTMNKVIDNTSAGGITCNDCLMHFIEPSLPFGGIGASGMGSYHGKKSFDTFSHQKAIMLKDDTLLDGVMFFRYPPYSKQKADVTKLIMFREPKESWWSIPKLFMISAALISLAFAHTYLL